MDSKTTTQSRMPAAVLPDLHQHLGPALPESDILVPLPADETPPAARSRWYLPVRAKFTVALLLGIGWGVFAHTMAEPWIADFSRIVGIVPAYLAIYGIAVIPGFINAFLIVSLLLDHRPQVRPHIAPQDLPGITILVAAYNEEQNILATLESINRQNYPGAFRVIAINDGSTDGTLAKLQSVSYPWLQVLHLEKNVGKANALNAALKLVDTPLTLTVDGDSYLFKDALLHLVQRYMSDPPNTRAVAGAVLVRNSRTNLVTKVQEWDYFHGIAAIKRLQSMYQGTLVAQGAFSAYDTAVLKGMGGWPHTVGEDIVVTWGILRQGWRVGFAENACLFTNAPDTWRQFIRQRQRWSRGLIEAFKMHWPMLFQWRMSMLFIWWNLLFPYLDLVYTVFFVPGLVLALFGIYWIAGPMTLLVLPAAMLLNYVIFHIQTQMFTEQGLKVRSNPGGFVVYSLLYSIILQPACVWGYVSEVFSRTKNWGTK